MMDIVQKLKSQIGDDVQHIFDHEALFKLAIDEIETLRAALAKPKVKPLVWSEWGQKNGGVTRYLKGECGGHTYKVTLHLDDSGRVHRLSSLGGEEIKSGRGLDYLKSAAQADHERRILSALEGHE